jgi:hypothetical protein
VPYKAVAAKRSALTTLIREVMAKEQVDSPVYEHLRIAPREITAESRARMLVILEKESDRLARHIMAGKRAVDQDKWDVAISELTSATKIIEGLSEEEGNQNRANRDFVLQQLALATYKSKQPDPITALKAGLAVISTLNPDDSHDTETLGIAGAIRKRLWEAENQRFHLEKAIEYYGRGFALKRDFYNGENFATCLVARSRVQQEAEERLYDTLTARKVRKEIVEILSAEFSSSDFADLAPAQRMWKHATMANCLFALDRDLEALEHESRFKALAMAQWQLETYESGKRAVMAGRG